jgi:hypothetical protein
MFYPMIFSKKPDFTKQTHSDDVQIQIRAENTTTATGFIPTTTITGISQTNINANNASHAFPQFARAERQQRESYPVREVETKLLSKVLEVPKVALRMYRTSEGRNSSCCSGAK